MNDQPPTVRFWFDYISPYAYLASTRLAEIEEQTGARVEPLPVLLAGLLGATGRLGPAEVPAQREYTFAEVQRIAARMGVEVRCPDSHPFNPLLPLRVTTAAVPQARRTVIEALYAAVWRRRIDVTGVEGIQLALADVDVDADALVELAGEAATKAELRGQTEAAIAAGAFGVPTFEAGGELFWGVQSIPYLQRHLAGGHEIDRDEQRRWRDLKATAVRRKPTG